MNQGHYEKLKQMYLSANVNTMMFDSTTAKIAEGTAEIGLTIHEKYFHALGAIHGSVYFKLLDDAAFFAVNSVVTDVFVLTKSFDIHFKKPVAGGKLKAIGTITSSSDYSFIGKSELLNEEGKVVAHGSGEFVKSKVQLTPEIGYV
ncbi:PaaI family thioesterase [Ekhidna sp. To15]|uniref:PaaI family thioesterase n=1 Tax=Ekhidna sp. To15 TaxID=3395267 RepID=UPI003F523F0F